MKSTNIAVVIWLFVAALMGMVACTSQETMPVESGDTIEGITTAPLTETETAVFTPTPTTQPTIIPSATSQPPATTPTAAPTKAPTATATVVPETAVSHLIAQAEHISVAGWSPDSEWLAYWLSTAADVDALDDPYAAPGGTLHLLNSNSGESCALPQFHTTSGEEVTLIWPADKSLIVRRWAANEQWQGQPCQPDSFVGDLTMPESPSAAANEEARLSPDGRFQITTVLQEETADHWRTLLTVLQEKEGAEITAVTWRTQADMAAGEVGGEWISPTQFFIRFAEEGPLLLDADQPGQVINVLSDLFALALPAERKSVVAAPGVLPDSFSLALVSGGVDRVQIYHADSGLVETLPYRRSASPPFSPDNQWLLLFGDGNDLWLRPIADVEGEWQRLAEEVSDFAWNSDSTEIAFSQFGPVIWQTFPQGEVIGEWATEPFISSIAGFSPNGRFLVVTGQKDMTGSWYKQALFLFDREAAD